MLVIPTSPDSGFIGLDSDRGKQLGFTSDRFGSGSYLWESDGRITVSFIESRAKGNFKGLVDAILGEGREVAVPTPLPMMERIVRKCGYTQTFEDSGMGESVEVWTLKPPSQQNPSTTKDQP